jgi:hypothetical protein
MKFKTPSGTAGLGVAAAGLALVTLAACATGRGNAPAFSKFQPGYDSSQKARSGSAQKSLEPGKNYVILIDDYDMVKQLSKLVGLPGKYGHIAVARNGRVFHCGPPQCEELSAGDFELRYFGRRYEIREIDINGNAERAIIWFRKELDGKPYIFFYRNCTDAVVGMYAASGDRTQRVQPLDVQATYGSNPALRHYMKTHGIPVPNRNSIFLPDQFISIGTPAGTGTFGR